MMKKTATIALIAASLLAAKSFAADSGVNVNVYSYAATGAAVTTTSAATLVVASPISVSKLEVCDTSGHSLEIGIGVSGSAVYIASTPVSGCIIIPTYVPAGTRFQIKAIDATASTGFNIMSFIQ